MLSLARRGGRPLSYRFLSPRLLFSHLTSPPVSLEIQDDSASHAGHRPESAGGGTHFRVEIVSESFEGMNTIKRHKAVYAVLAEQMEPAGTIHALSLSTKTPSD